MLYSHYSTEFVISRWYMLNTKVLTSQNIREVKILCKPVISPLNIQISSQHKFFMIQCLRLEGLIICLCQKS